MKKLLIISVVYFVTLNMSAQVLDTTPVEQKLEERKEEKLSEKSSKEPEYKIEGDQMVEVGQMEKAPQEVKEVQNNEALSEKNKGYKDPNEIQTIFKKGKSSSTGGYFGFYTKYSSINNYDALEIGARLAVVIGHGFAIGTEGTGFITDIRLDGNQLEYFTTGGYGGLLFEPIIMPKFPVHVSFPILLGGGAATNVYTDDYDRDMRQYGDDDVDVFLLACPGVEIEVNMTRFMRLSLTTSYRLTDQVGFDHDVLEKGGLEGFTYGLGLKFGKF